nr:retrovirus-related Pol polyprotein from transposon TNT 1-94 [Tanacetum cinerariifolium]
MNDMIKEKLALKEKVDSLEQNLSKQIKENECLLETFNIFQNESKEKENKYMENETDLEKKIKELDNIVYKVGQSAQTVHMLTKLQSFYDNVHKQALGYQNLFYPKKAQRIKPTLYDGIVIFEKHVAMPVIDDEETLILEEDNSGKRFNLQQELSAEQAFWLRISNPTIESSSTLLVKVEVPSELPKVSLVNESLKKLKFQLAQFDSVVKKKTTHNALTEVFDQMEADVQQSSVDKQCLEIANKELLLENDQLSIQIMSQDIISTVMNCMSFNVDCMNLGKATVDNAAQIPYASTVAPGMFKLDLEHLAPKLHNREIHINYLKHTQEQADILRGIVKQAKAKQPLDNALYFSCKHAKRIQELLVCVQDTCQGAIKPSEIKYLDSGCSKHMTWNRSQLMNFVSKFMGMVRFGNDQIARITGYGDYQLGNVIILRVYYVEGLRHNLFSIGQFYDADLEVAFRKNTCFIRNLEGVDLLSGSRDTNLYIISLDDMLKSSSICLLSKASKTKSWLWHHRLSHLNFACALGKSKKSSHQPKAKDTNQEKLHLLHMDLCGPMRVASINGKRYILIIVDDYSRFTWVRFLRTKDEVPVAIIKCIKNIQVRLKATIRHVRTDNGTEIVNQTLIEFYDNVGISHQTYVACTL